MPRLVVAILGVSLVLVAQSALAREGKAKPAAVPAEQRELFEAEASGAVTVKYIPNDSRSAQIVVTNNGDRPLSLRMPEAFAGVPVLAQMGGMPGGMNGGGNMAGFGASNQPQTTGGGVAQGGMQVGQGAGNGGFCWVAREVYGPHDPRWVRFRGWMRFEAPAWLRDIYGTYGEDFAAWIHDKPAAKWAVRQLMDSVVEGTPPDADIGGQFQVVADEGGLRVMPGKTRTIRVTTVCLEHGKAEPSQRRPYKLVKLDSYSQDPKLAVVLEALGRGELPQKVAQAAAWHMASGLSWERLSAEMIDHAGGVPDEPFFTPAELQAAHRVVEIATAQAASAGKATSQSMSGSR